MGSSGSGSFSDYSSQPSKKSPKKKSNKGQGGGSGGGASGKDPCEQVLTGVALDDVARSEYFVAHNSVCPKGSVVTVREQLFERRIAVELDSGEIIGLLPTQYNYLVACMKDGYSYRGVVTASSTTPYPRVLVDIRPSR
jgi:hypothetical protein